MKSLYALNKKVENALHPNNGGRSESKIQKSIANALIFCFLLLPESVDREVKQQRKEHLSARIVDPDYLKQAGIESLQWIYEHIHFLGGPIPKGIEIYKEQGTISKTPCPRLSPGRYGRVFLAGSDAIKGRYTYTMTYKLLGTEHALIEILSNNMIHNSVLIMTLPFSSLVYYFIVKNSDLYYAQEHILMEKMAKFPEKDEI